MKPLDGTYAENAQKWGVAGLNIDGGRIGTETLPERIAGQARIGTFERHDMVTPEHQGRFPANLLLDEESAKMLDEQSGLSSSSYRPPDKGGTGNCYTVPHLVGGMRGHDDAGGASRFFYTAKASPSERNAGLEDCEPKRVADDLPGGDNPRNRTNTPKRNFHPTVKPVDLMRYLCRLTKTPTGGVVLDPFMGSGTTGVACVLEHRDFIGIELQAEYAEIAKKRIEDMSGPLFAEAA